MFAPKVPPSSSPAPSVGPWTQYQQAAATAPDGTAAPGPWQQYVTNPEAGSLTAATASGASDLASPIEDPGKLAPIFGLAKASLPTDPGAKAKAIAKSLFPDLSDSAALSRIGYQNGRVIYLGDDNKTYYAEPSFDLSHPGRTFMEGRELAAGEAGPSIPMLPSMAAGAATTEFGGGVPAATAVAGGGDLVRQWLAHELTGETKPPMERALQTGEQMLLGGGGQLLGNVGSEAATAFLNKGLNPLRVGGYDIKRLTGPRLAQGEADTAAAQAMGVTVTPGEAMNSRSLLMRQRQLGRQEEGATPLGDFYAQRNTQLGDAWNRYVLDRLSSVTAPAVGARNLQQGAQETIDAAVAGRSAATRPFYQAAATDTVPTQQMQGVLNSIDAEIAKGGSDKVLAQLQALRNDLVAQGAKPAVPATLSQPGGLGRSFVPGSPGSAAVPEVPVTNVGALDSIRKYWRDRIALPAIAPEATPNEVSARITPILSQLRDTMQQASPDFAYGRATHEAMSPEVSNLEQGIVGLAAKDRAAGFQNVPTTMFGATAADPMSIASARNGFMKAGKMDEWNAGVRSYLDNLFQAAAKQQQGPATNLWSTISGNSKQLANLKAALAPDQFQALQDFMNVAKMVKRAPAEGSATAGDIGQRAAFASPLAKFAAGGARLLWPPNWPDMAREAILDASEGKNIERLVNTITQPDSIQLLRRLRALPPGSEKFTGALGQLATHVLAGQLSTGVPDQPIGSLGAMLNTPPTY
jgi:hypothetical protein